MIVHTIQNLARLMKLLREIWAIYFCGKNFLFFQIAMQAQILDEIMESIELMARSGDHQYQWRE